MIIYSYSYLRGRGGGKGQMITVLHKVLPCYKKKKDHALKGCQPESNPSILPAPCPIGSKASIRIPEPIGLVVAVVGHVQPQVSMLVVLVVDVKRRQQCSRGGHRENCA